MSRAGRFREEVTFQRLPVDAATDFDAYGNPVGAWADLGTVLADVREMPGREVFAAGRPEGTRLATVRVRAEPVTQGVTPADRMVARGVTWNIKSSPVQIDVKAMVLEFTAETGGAVQ